MTSRISGGVFDMPEPHDGVLHDVCNVGECQQHTAFGISTRLRIEVIAGVVNNDPHQPVPQTNTATRRRRRGHIPNSLTTSFIGAAVATPRVHEGGSLAGNESSSVSSTRRVEAFRVSSNVEIKVIVTIRSLHIPIGKVRSGA